MARNQPAREPGDHICGPGGRTRRSTPENPTAIAITGHKNPMNQNFTRCSYQRSGCLASLARDVGVKAAVTSRTLT
jgi:hypothetical protein